MSKSRLNLIKYVTYMSLLGDLSECTFGQSTALVDAFVVLWLMHR